jgi:hypothetical protein
MGDAVCRDVIYTELEGSSKGERRLEEEDRRGHGLKTDSSAIKDEEEDEEEEKEDKEGKNEN